MTGVGKIQGYTGQECKKDKLKVGEDRDDDGEEVVKYIGHVFFGVKQENLHVPGDGHGGSNVWCKRSRRWRAE